jgi:hypothetical protein
MAIGNKGCNLLNICLDREDNLSHTYINNRTIISVSTLSIILYIEYALFWERSLFLGVLEKYPWG